MEKHRYLSDIITKETRRLLAFGQGIQASNELSKNLTINQIKQLAKDKSDIWLVLSHSYKTGAYYRTGLSAKYQQIEEKHLKYIDIYRYKIG